MHQLAPIPPGSNMGNGFATIDAAIVAMRTAAKQVPNAGSRIYVHDHMSSNRSLTIENYRASGEGKYGWDEFYYHWKSRIGGSRHDDNLDISKLPGPHWIRIGTPHRLLWVEMLPIMLESLRGMPVTVSTSCSWTWDYENARPNGHPRHVREYEILLFITSDGAGFIPEPHVAELLKNVCRADHPLADQDLFSYQKDNFGKSTFSCYGWTEKGVKINFDTKELMEKTLAEMFPGIDHVTTRTGTGSGTTWHVELDLCA